MSLQPRLVSEIPEETQRVAKAAFRQGNRAMQMRNELGSLFSDEQFADLFPNVGRLAETPWRLALVTVLQFAENLTDRQAADAMRGRIDWKYALSLELTNAGFDFSVLTEFRSRLANSGTEARLFQSMLMQFEARGLLKSRGKQRTDSTYIVSAVHRLNQFELVHEALRHTLNELALLATIWLQQWVTAEWFERLQLADQYLSVAQKGE
jgi:transposase